MTEAERELVRLLVRALVLMLDEDGRLANEIFEAARKAGLL
jgi:hypothetical protein